MNIRDPLLIRSLVQKEDTLEVEINYPRIQKQDKVRFIKIELCDVRAADGIRVHYDFDRDGWIIEQASVFEWDADDQVCDPCWKEAAFVPAWQFEKKV